MSDQPIPFQTGDIVTDSEGNRACRTIGRDPIRASDLT